MTKGTTNKTDDPTLQSSTMLKRLKHPCRNHLGGTRPSTSIEQYSNEKEESRLWKGSWGEAHPRKKSDEGWGSAGSAGDGNISLSSGNNCPNKGGMMVATGYGRSRKGKEEEKRTPTTACEGGKKGNRRGGGGGGHGSGAAPNDRHTGKEGWEENSGGCVNGEKGNEKGEKKTWLGFYGGEPRVSHRTRLGSGFGPTRGTQKYIYNNKK